MLHPELHQLGLPAHYIRDQLVKLESERVAALTGGTATHDSSLAILREDIALWRELYVISSLTEIATLRAEVGGPQFG
jgi:hypothetical protein